jgi:hypothetical protein
MAEMAEHNRKLSPVVGGVDESLGEQLPGWQMQHPSSFF